MVTGAYSYLADPDVKASIDSAVECYATVGVGVAASYTVAGW